MKQTITAVVVTVVLGSAAMLLNSPAIASDQDADVKVVVDAISNDKDALKEFCASDMSSKQSQIRGVVTKLARSGKLQTSNYGAIGGAAGQKVASEKCS